MKIIIILGLILITLFLVSCTQVTCDKPYIKVGTSCCLDQNDNNICDNDEKNGVSQEPATQAVGALITKDAAELALYSNEIEAGYSLNRKSSGIYQYDLEDFPELKSTDLKETFVTSYTKPGTEAGETRWLTIYNRKFETVEGAKDGFKLIKDTYEKNPLLEKKEWLLKAGEENVVFLHNYLYDFYPYSKYVGLVRTRNTIAMLMLNVPAGERAGQELENYMKKLETKALTATASPPEVDAIIVSKISSKKENLIELKINSFKKAQSVPRNSEYEGYKIENVVGTNRNYLTINLYLKNLGIENGFDTSYYNFILVDENGNYYTADYRSIIADGAKEEQLLSKGTGFGTAYFFTVLKDSNDFTLTVYDGDVEIYEISIG